MLKGLLAAIAVVAAAAMPAAAQVTGKVTPADMPIAVPENTALLAPTLKHSTVVTGDVVRIGDLIDNAGVFASIPVFRSPDVGTTGSVPARKVIEAAHAHNLYGVDTGDVVQIEVTRTGRVIAKPEIEARIMRLFAGTNGLSTTGNLVLGFDREVATFYADLAPDADLRAMRAAYEPRSGRFDVVFEVPLGTSRRTLMRYTGSLVEAVDAVVPVRSIARGEVVRSADVIVERRSKADTSGEVVASLVEAVGRAARQGAAPGSADPACRSDEAGIRQARRERHAGLRGAGHSADNARQGPRVGRRGRRRQRPQRTDQAHGSGRRHRPWPRRYRPDDERRSERRNPTS